jgi:hypothetical protein
MCNLCESNPVIDLIRIILDRHTSYNVNDFKSWLNGYNVIVFSHVLLKMVYLDRNMSRI